MLARYLDSSPPKCLASELSCGLGKAWGYLILLSSRGTDFLHVDGRPRSTGPIEW